MAYSAQIEHAECGVSDECGCHEEHCTIYPFEAILHLEHVASAIMLLDSGEEECDESLPAISMDELRKQAVNFVNDLFNGEQQQ